MASSKSKDPELPLISCFQNLAKHLHWSDWEKHAPVGIRFMPSEQELVGHYLRVKKFSSPGSICKGLFGEFDLYKYDPDNLPPGLVHCHANGRMYIFTPLHKLKQHRTDGTKAKRNTPNGVWKMNASPIPVKDQNGQTIGTKACLVYFSKKNSSKAKTQWLMHEFRIEDPTHPTQIHDLLDDCALCVVYNCKEESQDKKNWSATNYIQNKRSRGHNVASSQEFGGPSSSNFSNSSSQESGHPSRSDPTSKPSTVPSRNPSCSNRVRSLCPNFTSNKKRQRPNSVRSSNYTFNEETSASSIRAPPPKHRRAMDIPS